MFHIHNTKARPMVALVVLASVAATLGVVVSGAATASSNARASRIFSRETVGPATKITEVHVTPRLTAEGSGVKSVYVYGHMEVKPGEVAGGDIPCPRHTHPVSGLFSSNSPKVFQLESVPAPFESSVKAARAWTVIVVNQDTQTAGVLAGAVCEA